LADLPLCELHLHTSYSFLDGASQPEELVEQAKKLGYRALAITDHDGLHGAVMLAVACRQAGIQAITGVELTLRQGVVAKDLEWVHLTLLAATSQGYTNLCTLISAAHKGRRPWEHKEPWRSQGPGRLDRPRAPASGDVLPPGVDPSFLRGHTAGLIALTGCRDGELCRLVDAGHLREASALLDELTALFGKENLYVELQHNLVKGDTQRLKQLTKLAQQHNLPTVATGDVHYHDRSRHRLHDAMTALRHHATLESSHRVRRANSEFYLRPPAKVAAFFAEYPEALANQQVIADRCRAFDLSDPTALAYLFPDFDRAAGERGADADEVLRRHCLFRLGERYADKPDLREAAAEQLHEELALIARHKLSGFFLIYRDLQILATEVAQRVRGEGTVRGGSGLPPGRGRGSSVSSIVCYLIGLSHVDPVATKLFFKRFLNEDLRSIPDIDLDFARDIREALILAVYRRYGPEHAALVCNFATYHIRSAVRDFGKVLGLPPAAIDKLAKLSEGGGADTVRQEIERLPDLAGQAEGPLWGLLAELAAEVDGFPRHMGQHVGGMVISSRPIASLVPVQPGAIEGRYVCQWDKDSVDDTRLVKIDFLALGMLSLVEECLELIWQNRGEKVDLSRQVDYDDEEVYDQICLGDTIGMFQIESRAQIQMLTRTQPRTLNDLAVQVAIVRPGPIVGGAVNPYVRRREMIRQNPNYKPPADHPMLDDTLADTLGVVLFQDQVLEVAVKMGKFTPGQADTFRRAMSRRRSAEVMESFRAQFVAGATSQGVDAAKAEEIFDKLRGFSEFGFPKSHAHAFAVLAYQSAWLRHYYPAEFYAALLNNQPMGFYAPHVLVGDARRHGITVLRPSVNASEARTIPRGEDTIRLGLATIQGVGEELTKTIAAERKANGRYLSLRDLMHRTGMARDVAANLIEVGAAGNFGLSRREMLWQLGLLIPEPKRRVAGATVQQLSLSLPTVQDEIKLPDMNEWERMVADYGLMQLSPSYHPMGLARPHLPGLLTAAQIRQQAERDERALCLRRQVGQLLTRQPPPLDPWSGASADERGTARPTPGRRVRTAGLVVCRQRPGTAKGFVFLLIEDETGLTNVVVRPDLYEAHRSIVRGSPYLRIDGRVRLESGSLNLLADRIEPLELSARAFFSTTGSFFMPRPTIRHVYPGNPHDPREAAAAAEAASPPPPPRELTLAAVVPASHDFH
jgi:error-prone DNA polymerase